MDDLLRRALERIPVEMEHVEEMGDLYQAYAKDNPCMLATTSFNYGLLVGLRLSRFEKDLPEAETKDQSEE